MLVKKFHGSTAEEAEGKAKKSLGPSAIILMNKTVKKKGLFSSGHVIEVTAALEEKGDKDAEQEEVLFSSPKEKSQDSLVLSMEARKHLNGVPKEKSTVQMGSQVAKVNSESDDQDQALEAMKRRRAGKLEVIKNVTEDFEESRNIQDIKAYVKNEVIQAQKSVSVSQTRTRSPFLPFLLRRGIEQSIANQIDKKLSELFGNINLSTPSDERTECFKMLKREISSRIAIHGPICLDRYRTTYACLVGGHKSGKFSSAAKLAIQYSSALDKKVGIITLGAKVEEKPVMLLDSLKNNNVDVVGAHSLKDLSQNLDSFSTCDLILICYDKTFSEQYTDQSISGLRHLLSGVSFHVVLSAQNSESEIDSLLKEYSMLSFDSLIMTHLDKAKQLGSLVNICQRTHIPLSYLGIGAKIPEDLKIADQQELSKKMLLEEGYHSSRENLSKIA